MKRIFAVLLLVAAFLPSHAQKSGKCYALSLGGKAMMTKNSGRANFDAAVLWTETGVASQRWIAGSAGDGSFSLRNAYSGLYLCCGQVAANSSLSQRQKAVVTGRGSWNFIPVDGQKGVYTISPKNDKSLLITAEANAEGSKLVLRKATEADPSLCYWTLTEDEGVDTVFSKRVADNLYDSFLKQYYHEASVGHVLGKGGFWGDAEMLETILDGYETTADKRYKDVFEELYKNFINRNGSYWKGNEYNDDISWMVLACIRAYKFFGTDTYLHTARRNFDMMYSRASTLPDGMLVWKQSSPLGSNSCINGPATIAACYLGEFTGDETYWQKAAKIYAGQRSHLFEPSTGRVWDSGSWNNGSFKVGNTWSSTYNQGTMLGAALKLYAHTKNESYRQDAEGAFNYAFKHMTKDGILVNNEETVGGDLCGFKGIFMRYARLYAEQLFHPEAETWIGANALHCFQNRNSKGVSWSRRLTKTSENLIDADGNDVSNDAFGASTAVSTAFNAHVGGCFVKNAFASTSAALLDDVCRMQLGGEPEGSEADTCLMSTRSNAWAVYRNVDFGNRTAQSLRCLAKASVAGGKLSVYLDSVTTSTKLCSATVPTAWTYLGMNVGNVSGRHTLIFVFSDPQLSMASFSFGESPVSGIVAPRKTSVSLSAQGNRLRVDSSATVRLEVYGVDGTLQKSCRLSAGRSEVLLSEGLHVVRATSQEETIERKVCVRVG